MKTIAKTIRRAIFCFILVTLSDSLYAKSTDKIDKIDKKDIMGCWNRVDNQNWEYGFFENFAVYNCDFWEYKSIVSSSNKSEITLQKGTKTIKLKLTFDNPSGDVSTIVSNEGGKEHRLFRSAVRPQYSQADNSSFADQDNGYRMDSATVIGYLRGSVRKEPFEVSITNIISDEDETFYADIDSLGRFRMKIPVMNTSNIFIDWHENGLIKQGVVAPGDTLFIFHDQNGNQTQFMGRNARLNNEILAYPRPENDNPIIYDEKIPNSDFLKKAKERYQTECEAFDRYVSANPMLSDKFKYLTEKTVLVRHAELLMQRRFTLRRNFNKEQFSSDYMIYVDSLFTKIPQLITLCRTTGFLLDYLDYYAGINSCPVTMGHIEVARHLQRTGRYRLTDSQLFDMTAFEQGFSIEVMGKDYGADSQLIDSLKKPYINGMQRTNTLMADATLQKLIKECEPIVGELMELKNLSENFDFIDRLNVPQIVKEFQITNTYWKRLYDMRKPLLPSSIRMADSLLSNDCFKQVILNKQQELIAIQNQGMYYSESLKNTDHLKESKDADKLLSELIAPYKGKIIYIDFWGTWCGPCKKEMSYMPEVKTEMADKDIIFMYFANNSNKESWHNVIKEFKLTGPNVVHYNLPSEQQRILERRLAINSFPTYIIIGKNGQIIDMNPPHPSQTNLLKQRLNELLSQ